MADMFHNYDNHINRKYYDKPPILEDPNKILMSDTVVKMVYNIKGDQIGVQAKYKDDFYLYFDLCGTVDGGPIDELIYNSTINFQILDFYHNIIIDKIFTSECYDCETGTITVYINRSEAEKLKRDSYRMQLSLTWPDGGYELFAEKDALLIIR